MQGLSAQDLIDFAPVYRCLHIYSVLVSTPFLPLTLWTRRLS